MSTPIRLNLGPSEAQFAASDVASGVVGLTIYTGAAVDRVGYYADEKGREQFGRYVLRLSMDPAAVDLGRLNSGNAPLLRQHTQHVDAVIGRVVEGSAQLGDSLTAQAALSDAPGDADIVAKIRGGIVRGLSVGAFLHTIEAEDLTSDPPRFVATRWEPFEASAVAVGADSGASVQLHLIAPPVAPAHQPRAAPAQEPVTMSTAHAPAGFTPAQLAERNQGIRHSAALLGLAADHTHALIDDPTVTLADARAKLFELKASAGDAHGIDAGRRIEVGTDDRSKLGETMAKTLAARFQGITLADGDAYKAREFRHASIPEMAVACLRANGTDTAGMTRSGIIDAAMAMRSEGAARAYLAGHSTSDFPYVLGDSVTRTLRTGYELFPGIHRTIARRRNLRDYRAAKHVLLGDAPDFVETAQGGSTVYGPMTESQGSVSLKDYTAGVAVTRQVLINDDLGAFMDLAMKFGQKAMRKEERIVLAILTGGTSGDWGDGDPLFHSNHANIDTTGAAPSVARLGAMRALMRKQTSLAHGSQTEEPLDIMPRFLIVPVALEVTAQQLFSAGYMPTSASTAMVPSLGGLQVVSSPVLDENSATKYYLSADPAVFDALEYCYLEGESGLVVANQLDFDTEGFNVRARLSFAAHAKDFRGLVYNAGA